SGQVVVERTIDNARHEMARLGPGRILGEFNLLEDAPASATVRAITDVEALTANREDAQELLAIAPVRSRLEQTARRRHATNRLAGIDPVTVQRSGRTFALRPLWPDDWRLLDATAGRTSPESLRKRFFQVPKLHEGFLRKMTNVDYLAQFAWAVIDDDGIAAVGRYASMPDAPDTAELALLVADDLHGSGLGKVLLAALAAAATEHGITTFVATALADNKPVQGLLTRFGATWEPGDRGQEVQATWPVADALEVAGEQTGVDVQALRAAASSVLGD
ncbi:MAG: RimJ/RimL family protein N-acetyltransferase, partial [Glaciecola sp.]